MCEAQQRLPKATSFTPKGVTSFCVRKRNDVFALRKMMFATALQNDVVSEKELVKNLIFFIRLLL